MPVRDPAKLKTSHALLIHALKSSLDRMDTIVDEGKAKYLSFNTQRIRSLAHQTAAVKAARTKTGIWVLEMVTASGKTVVAARIVGERLSRGPALYICPNATAIGDTSQGIINKFHRHFSQSKLFWSGGDAASALGQLNDLSIGNSVSFVTPWKLVEVAGTAPRLLQQQLEAFSCIVVDETHHFPSGRDDLKVFGRVHAIVKRFVSGRGRLVVAMTGTAERLDRNLVLGKAEPDWRYSLQEAVDDKICPEVYGVQVLLDIRAQKATVGNNGVYDVHLRGGERRKFWDRIAECMAEVYRRCPVPTSAFVARVEDAQEIVERFNRLTKLGERGLRVLLGQTPLKERLGIIQGIADGMVAGYVTCQAGEEAIDAPRLEVVHLVRRTRSYVRLSQAVGRGLRVHPDKKRLLLVDYQMMTEGLQARWLGLSLPDHAVRQGVRRPRKQMVSGGPLVRQRRKVEARIVGASMDEERALVCNGSHRDVEWDAMIAELRRRKERGEDINAM
jgi:superfamily II DNA or RNA helicase